MITGDEKSPITGDEKSPITGDEKSPITGDEKSPITGDEIEYIPYSSISTILRKNYVEEFIRQIGTLDTVKGDPGKFTVKLSDSVYIMLSNNIILRDSKGVYWFPRSPTRKISDFMKILCETNIENIPVHWNAYSKRVWKVAQQHPAQDLYNIPEEKSKARAKLYYYIMHKMAIPSDLESEIPSVMIRLDIVVYKIALEKFPISDSSIDRKNRINTILNREGSRTEIAKGDHLESAHTRPEEITNPTKRIRAS